MHKVIHFDSTNQHANILSLTLRFYKSIGEKGNTQIPNNLKCQVHDQTIQQ